jgi:NADH-quinone oxidoreductase subunit N
MTDLTAMRYELLLVAALVLLLISGGIKSRGKNRYWIPVSMLTIITAIGFMPLPDKILFGGMFLSAPLTSVLKIIITCLALIIMVQSVIWLKNNVERNITDLFSALFFLSLLGCYFMISSGHFLIFFLGLELSTLPMAGIAVLGGNTFRRTGSGFRIIIHSMLASALMMFGFSLIYGACGTLYFSELIRIHMGSTLQVLGFFFFLTGMAYQISIVPFHFMRSDIVEDSQISAASFILVISTGTAILMLNVLIYSIFPSIPDIWQKTLFVIAIVTVTVSNLVALWQKSLMRFLAWTSMAQAGYIIIGIIGSSQTGMAAVIFYYITFAFSTLAVTGSAAIIRERSGSVNIEDLKGLYKSNPRISLLLTVAFLSLAGIPPLAGFFGKLLVFTAVAEKGFFFLLLTIAPNLLISLYAYLNVIRKLFITSVEKPHVSYFRSDSASRIGLIICAVGTILTGFAGFLLEFIRNFTYGA